MDAVGSLLLRQALKAPPCYPHLNLVVFFSAYSCDLGAGPIEVGSLADCAIPSVIVPGNTDGEMSQRIPFSLLFASLLWGVLPLARNHSVAWSRACAAARTAGGI